MVIETKAFGSIEVSEKQKIYFEQGILGFEDIHSFYLLDFPEGDAPFFWLQSEDFPEIAFILISPDAIIPDYKLVADAKEYESIDITNDNEILVFSIVTIYDNPENSTVNMLGPIVINKRNKKARQMISLNDKYTVRHPLIKKG